jgi:hypothetical protein
MWNLERVGVVLGCGIVIVKSVALSIVPPDVTTVILPVEPDPTIAVMDVSEWTV